MARILSFYNRIWRPNFFEVPTRVLFLVILYSLRFKKNNVYIFDFGLSDVFLDFITGIFTKIVRIKFYLEDFYQINANKTVIESNKKWKINLKEKKADLVVLSPSLATNFCEILSIIEDSLNPDVTICIWDVNITLQIDQLSEIYSFRIIFRKKISGLYPLDIGIITNLKRKNA